MKNALLIITENIGINTPFLEYIFNHYKAHFKEIANCNFADKSDKDLPFIIENLSIKFDTLLIYSLDESYATAAKILATLSDDSLELKNGETLALSRSLRVSKDSFVIELNSAKINLLKANQTQKLPQILIEPNADFEYFYLVDVKKDSAEILLDPIAKTYEVQFSLSQVVKNLILIRAEANKFGQIKGFMQGVGNLFANKIILGENFIEHIAKILVKNGLKITFSESCTGGLLASKFTAIAGVSAAFEGGLVTYSNRIKNEWLGVSKDVFNTQGAVSKECVLAMLKGAITSSGADFAIAVSGIAGPDGGSEQKPVGTVFVGAMSKNGNGVTQRLNLNGDRAYIREQSAIYAYLCLVKLKPELFLSEI